VGTAVAPKHTVLRLQEGLEFSYYPYVLVALVLAMEKLQQWCTLGCCCISEVACMGGTGDF
jgi:hypothetical protein